MAEKAFQDYYPDNLSHCYGCGRLNVHGLQIKSYWDGEESVCHYQPRPYHTAVPGYTYGGLIASLIDCHSTGTAAAAKYREAGLPMDADAGFRFLTASLHVDYLKPTPLNTTLVIRSKVSEIKGRKVVVLSEMLADGVVTARGEAVCVQVPDAFLEQLERDLNAGT